MHSNPYRTNSFSIRNDLACLPEKRVDCEGGEPALPLSIKKSIQNFGWKISLVDTKKTNPTENETWPHYKSDSGWSKGYLFKPQEERHQYDSAKRNWRVVQNVTRGRCKLIRPTFRNFMFGDPATPSVLKVQIFDNGEHLKFDGPV